MQSILQVLSVTKGTFFYFLQSLESAKNKIYIFLFLANEQIPTSFLSFYGYFFLKMVDMTIFSYAQSSSNFARKGPVTRVRASTVFLSRWSLSSCFGDASTQLQLSVILFLQASRWTLSWVCHVKLVLQRSTMYLDA